MTKEDLQALLESDESIKSSLKELGYESAEDVEGLKRKRDELLGKNKVVAERLREMQAQIEQFDIEG